MNIIENSLNDICDLSDYLRKKFKNFILSGITTSKQREKYRENHCLKHCVNSIFLKTERDCSGRHVYNDYKMEYSNDLLYFCKDCPYKERADYW